MCRKVFQFWFDYELQFLFGLKLETLYSYAYIFFSRAV